MASMSDYLENKLIDFLYRGQAFVPPASLWMALYTSAPSDAGGGTEVTGGDYARVEIVSALANWAGTQGAGTTTASSGTGGVTSNNAAIQFPAPSANWGVITHFAILDASSSGNVWHHGALSIPKTVNNGDAAPVFDTASMTITHA